MREIKFRAWTGSEMITPPCCATGTGSSAEIIELALDGQISLRNFYGLDAFGKNPAFDEPEQGITLMQYTGLKDINGNDIYESDILKVRDPYNKNWSTNGAEVIFSNEYVGGWVISNGEQNLNLGTRQNNIEIIGNIYENPELITKI